MIVIGTDTHKRSHTVAAVNEATGRVIADLTMPATRHAFEDALVWARGHDDPGRVWAIEDCRHVSGALERFLLARGERVVRVPPKLLAGARDSGRERGKSDVIDAVAIARAAIRDGLDTLPVAQLAGPELDVRLLVDHRERLVAQRTALIKRPALAAARSLARRRGPVPGADHRPLARPHRAPPHTQRTDHQGTDRARRAAPRPRAHPCHHRARARTRGARRPARAQLLAEQGCGVLTAAKLIGEIAGVSRFATDAKLARTAAAAPIPASSGRTDRHRLDRGGNRQINCARHRIAVTKARIDPETAAYLARKQSEGKSRREALRCLKRHLARRVFKLLQSTPPTPATPGDRSPAVTTPGVTIHCNNPSIDIGATDRTG